MNKNIFTLHIFSGMLAHQLCQPYVSFCIAFSIKPLLLHENFSHWHNAKMKDQLLSRFSNEKDKKSKYFSYFTMETGEYGMKLNTIKCNMTLMQSETKGDMKLNGYEPMLI